MTVVVIAWSVASAYAAPPPTMRVDYYHTANASEDAASGRTIFSRGFASIYGEWETTAEAKAMNRTVSESLRFPLVDRPARIVLKKRDARNAFRIRDIAANAPYDAVEILVNGTTPSPCRPCR